MLDLSDVQELYNVMEILHGFLIVAILKTRVVTTAIIRRAKIVKCRAGLSLISGLQDWDLVKGCRETTGTGNVQYLKDRKGSGMPS